MMRWVVTILLACIVYSIPLFGQEHFTARTKLFQKTSKAQIQSTQQLRSYFVDVEDSAFLSEIQSKGIRINSRFGSLAAVQLNDNQLSVLGTMGGIRRISAAIPMTLTNDSARYLTNVDVVHSLQKLKLPYTGRNVILGIIDTGIDFNHITFMGNDGKSRVKRVYMPYDSTGVSPVIDGDTLPGSHYFTPETIAALTTDTPTASHGTHTAGTAAGSCMTNNYYGVAPDVDLVLCGMPSLYDTDIANSIKYILDYAEQVGKPVVISMSFSSQEGAHDGTSPLCRLFDSESSPGRVFVISAGNNARERVYLQKSFASNDSLRTYIDGYYSSAAFNGFVSSWSANDNPHRVALTVIDKNSHKEIISLPYFEICDSMQSFVVDSIPELKPYFTGTLNYASAIEDNGRFHSIVEMGVTPSESRYRIGLKYAGRNVGQFKAWSSGVIMVNDANVSGYKSAVRDHCISDLATCDGVISVGAYCSRKTIPSISQGVVEYSRSTPVDIAYFSSYGPDDRGINRPDICGPGLGLVSSASRYMESMMSSASYIETVDGIDYPYVGMSGTSMSTPFVAGVIALWMQHYPKLESGIIRDVFENTAIRDSYVANGDSKRWGYGKIDAFGGLMYLRRLFPTPKTGDFNDDGVVDISDVNKLINIILNR